MKMDKQTASAERSENIFLLSDIREDRTHRGADVGGQRMWSCGQGQNCVIRGLKLWITLRMECSFHSGSLDYMGKTYQLPSVSRGMNF